mmetsp:Transcript_36871/g.56435  ORF Transcript_36871/g.56435 Transcript_36871/m.56435 type:complete len:90 (+) Transcript_36871:259-528(+)
MQGMLLVLRTVIALLFGIWCHFVHVSSLRFNNFAHIMQDLFSFPSFLLVNFLIHFLSSSHNQSVEQEISALKAIVSGEKNEKSGSDQLD